MKELIVASANLPQLLQSLAVEIMAAVLVALWLIMALVKPLRTYARYFAVLVLGLLALWSWFHVPATDVILESVLVKYKAIGSVRFVIWFTTFFSALMVVQHYRASQTPGKGIEGIALITVMAIGVFLLTVSNNTLVLFVSLEVVSVCSYLLAGFMFNNRGASAALQYGLFGSIVGAITLFGLSLLYALSGTVDYSRLSLAFEAGQILALVPLFMVYTGLFFKAAIPPFHGWVSNVYSAAPAPYAAWFSVIPKLGAIYAMAHLSTAFGPGLPMVFGNWFLAIVALGAITLGNVGGLLQKDFKSLLAFSSVAHAGFMLAFIPGGVHSTENALPLFAFGYVMANLAAFGWISGYEEQATGASLSRFDGLAKYRPIEAVAITIILLSLAGLPPTFGFIIKLNLFVHLFQAWQVQQSLPILLLFIGATLNASVAIYFYLKLPYRMFFKSSPTVLLAQPSIISRLFLYLFALAVLFFFIFPNSILNHFEF